jgi:hypothetical protein
MSEVDDFLAHYGVSGMKWGRRSGGLKDRVKGAMSDSVERRMVTNKAIADGKGQTRDYRRVALKRGGGFATGAALSTGSRKIAKGRAKVLESRLKRVKSGKINRGDVIDAMFNTPVTDLLVSRRDKRALPGSKQDKVNKGSQVAAKLILGVGGAAILSLNTKQNRAVAGRLIKIGANAAINSAVMAKKKSNSAKAYNTKRSDTHGITNYPTIRMNQNPTTGNWV